MKTTGDQLRDAATRVRNGWTRWEFQDGQGHVCAAGALGMISGHDVCRQVLVHAEALYALARALGKPRGNALMALIAIQGWNDAEGQTAENVAAGFELAAILADEEAAGKQRAVRSAMEGWWV
jgi:hypothetical protein